MDEAESISIISIVGKNNSDCGYCHSEDTSFTYGIWAHALSYSDYQSLIDRGWRRRSGHYVYKPDLRKSCCPQYTIRLDAQEFKISKSQRKVLNKFNRFIDGTWDPDTKSENTPQKKPPKPKNDQALTDIIHAAETQDKDYRHKLEPCQIVLEPASYTKEKYDVYCKYQTVVHNDKKEELSTKSFKRFLVESPMKVEKTTNTSVGYGSYHQKYLLDGKLIAMAVLDILPKCVSSVYFLYDPDYSFLGLGKYSALREISLVQDLNQQKGKDDLKWYYMGYYIHSCPKMNYKGQYQPSYLLDPLAYQWFPLAEYQKLLDTRSFVSLARPDKEDADPGVPPGWLDPGSLTREDLKKVLLLVEGGMVAPAVSVTSHTESSKLWKAIKEYVAAVGLQLSERMIIC
ncbi:arginine-tRNA-protein transferase [Radiomyces spectabilis]|uniref:arginine-tRNA-protein transferase n=1 Tax=Radiomyces spectabilis TaxID=64574 RepID=UPI00221FBA69|nr:arginine-tRNA-protein transferase [Radiomyces spectabilis]KAI8391164.1 arginine-tRNA-protein transferase [Radiomyces spectabilis]